MENGDTSGGWVVWLFVAICLTGRSFRLTGVLCAACCRIPFYMKAGGRKQLGVACGGILDPVGVWTTPSESRAGIADSRVEPVGRG